jgi:hypothetical protein
MFTVNTKLILIGTAIPLNIIVCPATKTIINNTKAVRFFLKNIKDILISSGSNLLSYK